MYKPSQCLQVIIIILLIIIVAVIIYSYWDFYSANNELFKGDTGKNNASRSVSRPSSTGAIKSHPQMRSQSHQQVRPQNHPQFKGQGQVQGHAQINHQMSGQKQPGNIVKQAGPINQQTKDQIKNQLQNRQAGTATTATATGTTGVAAASATIVGDQVNQISSNENDQINQDNQTNQANQPAAPTTAMISSPSITKNDRPEQGIYKFVVYHMNGCGPCQNIMVVKSERNGLTKFDMLKNIYASNPNVQILDFQYQRDAEANKYNGFPVVKLITPDDEIEYNGPRTVQSMADFINKNIN